MSIYARAAKAADIIMLTPTWGHLPRAFDDCFENGDGNEVLRQLLEWTVSSPLLRSYLVEHCGEAWYEVKCAELLSMRLIA